MDKIIIENMQFYGYHGMLSEENRLGQRFAVSLVLGTDIRTAAGSDDLGKTIDYAMVYEAVREIMEGPWVKLLETLAEKIACRVLGLGVTYVRVTVKKLHPPIPGSLDCVAVEIERSRQ